MSESDTFVRLHALAAKHAAALLDPNAEALDLVVADLLSEGAVTPEERAALSFAFVDIARAHLWTAADAMARRILPQILVKLDAVEVVGASESTIRAALAAGMAILDQTPEAAAGSN